MLSFERGGEECNTSERKKVLVGQRGVWVIFSTSQEKRPSPIGLNLRL